MSSTIMGPASKSALRDISSMEETARRLCALKTLIITPLPKNVSLFVRLDKYMTTSMTSAAAPASQMNCLMEKSADAESDTILSMENAMYVQLVKSMTYCLMCAEADAQEKTRSTTLEEFASAILGTTGSMVNVENAVPIKFMTNSRKPAQKSAESTNTDTSTKDVSARQATTESTESAADANPETCTWKISRSAKLDAAPMKFGLIQGASALSVTTGSTESAGSAQLATPTTQVSKDVIPQPAEPTKSGGEAAAPVLLDMIKSMECAQNAQLATTIGMEGA